MLVAAVLAVLTAALLPAPSGARERPLVTLIGDSVALAVTETPTAVQVLDRRVHVRLDSAGCRRLAEASCTLHGVTPPSARAEVQANQHRLGRVVVIAVGYNDSPLY